MSLSAAVKAPAKNTKKHTAAKAVAKPPPKKAANVPGNDFTQNDNLAQFLRARELKYQTIYNSGFADTARNHIRAAALSGSCDQSVRAQDDVDAPCDCNDCGPCCVKRVTITCADLPYVISCPGYYELECDAKYNVVDAFVPAIQIVSNDVTLDLCGHTLSQCGETPWGYGLVIGQGYFPVDQNAVYKNITVKNGTIRDFSGNGITAINLSFTNTNVPNPDPVNLPYEDLHFYDLNVLHNGTTTAYFDSIQGIQFDGNVFIDGFYDNTTTPEVAFRNVVMERVHSNENFCALLNGVNCSMLACDNVVVRDSQFNNTEGIGGSGFAVIANNVEFTDNQVNGTSDRKVISCNRFLQAASFIGNNMLIKNSQFNDSYSECCGIRALILNGDNFLVEDCQVNNTRAGSVFGLVAGSEIVGISMFSPGLAQASGSTFVRCQSNGHGVNSDNQARGYIAGIECHSYSDVEFIDCQVCDINAEAPLWTVLGAFVWADGFPNNYAKNVTFTRFQASNLSGHQAVLGIVGTTNSIGLPDTSPSDNLANMVVEDAVVEKIHSTSATERVAGIANCLFPFYFSGGAVNTPLPMENLFVKGCRVADVYADSSNPICAGILLESAERPVVEENTVSDCQHGILLTGTYETQLTPIGFLLVSPDSMTLIEYGWQVDPDTWPVNNPITNNQLFTRVATSQQVTVTPSGIYQSTNFPIEDISSWTTGDNLNELIYNVPPGGIPIQLFDPDACRNQVPYSGEVGATATYDGIGLVTGFNSFWTQSMVGGTITLADSSSATITGFVDRFTLEVTSGLTANDPQSYVITYPNDGQLINGQTVYGAITPPNTTVPGFTNRAVVKDNTVNSCEFSGIRDNRKPCTSSLFLSNTAFCNGSLNKNHNYHIHWGHKAPVAEGNLSRYPEPKNSAQNLSIACGKHDCQHSSSSSSCSSDHHHRAKVKKK